MIAQDFARTCGFAVLLSGCTLEHHAPLHSAELPPLAPTVLHETRLWLDLAQRVPENACVAPGDARLLCFERLRSTLGLALTRSLWSSFPGVEIARPRQRLPEADYVLHVELGLDALPPDSSGPGWSAAARGSWVLEHEHTTLASQRVACRSRSEFAYGAELGAGASEVIDAIAVRIGMALGGIPESRVPLPIPLPEVWSEPLGEILAIPAASAQGHRAAF